MKKELATKACDAMEFVESDIYSIYKRLTKENPMGAEYVLSILGDVRNLKAKINTMYGAIEND